MTDMRDDDWRLDDTLTEAGIRQKMAEEGWESVEAVNVHYIFTSVPQRGAYTTVTTVVPGAHMNVQQEKLPQTA